VATKNTNVPPQFAQKFTFCGLAEPAVSLKKFQLRNDEECRHNSYLDGNYKHT